MWFSLSYPETSVEKWPGILKCPHIHIPMMPCYKQRSPEGAGCGIGEAVLMRVMLRVMRLWDKNAIEKTPAKMAKLEEQITVLVVNYGISNTIGDTIVYH